MANYDAMLEQKKMRVNKNIELINKACEELINIKDKITYKIISEKTKIPIKTLQNKSYKECIHNWRILQGGLETNKEYGEYLEEIKYLNKVIKQLRAQNEQLKYELYNNIKFNNI
ncbi:MAG: hypothetical protein KHZ99_17015 [Clostridium sp.]|uniref:hypothetical protein n=1 Tax=Clostridium sp. TaxID=1506 RepID=UPI0025B94144|nr:hypothetical protein [Clostridium sp.]MBS4958714.1 hypothetical protein [Clostridium sp.]